MRCNVLRRPPQNHNLTTSGFRSGGLPTWVREFTPGYCSVDFTALGFGIRTYSREGSADREATFVAVMCTLLYRRDVNSSSSSS